MLLTLIALLPAVGLFLGMLLFLEIGRRIGAGRLARDPEGLPKGVSAAEAAVFGRLGLVVAFSFSGAASRFEVRRHLIIEEVNAIGTAYLRIALLPAGLSLIGSVLAGYSMSVNKGRSLLHALAFSAMSSLAVYVIIALEFPRLGLVRIDAADRLLIDLRQGMN